MAFDGSGNFNRVHNWGQDAAAAINIESSRMDAEDNNFASGLSAVLVRDGQAPMTGALNFGSNKGTNLATPTADNDAVNKTYVDTNFVGNQGGVLTGSDPFLGFQNTDEAANVQRWRIGMDTSAFTIEPLQSDGSAGVGFGAVSFSRDENGIVGATLPNIAVSNDTSNTLLSLFSDAMPQILFDDGGAQATLTWDGPNTTMTLSNKLTVNGILTSSQLSAGKVALRENDGHGNANVTFNCEEGVIGADGMAARLRADTDSADGLFYLQILNNATTAGGWSGFTNVVLADATSFTLGVNTTINGTLTATGTATLSGGADIDGGATISDGLTVDSGTTALGTTTTGSIVASAGITGSSLVSNGSVTAGTNVFASNGNLYARGAAEGTARWTYYQNTAGSTNYGYVGWSNGTNGMAIVDQNHGNSYYCYGSAGSYKGHKFNGDTAVALDAGMRTRAGQSGTWGNNKINFSWASPDVSIWVDGSNQGTIFTSSDERFKDIIPGDFDALGVINQMTLQKYKWKDMPADEEKSFPGQVDDGKEYFGVMAQQVAELFPAAAYGDPSEMIKVPTAWAEEEDEVEEIDEDGKVKKVKIKRKGDPTAWADTDIPQKMGLHPLHLCNLLLGAVQQLSARLEALEGA